MPVIAKGVSWETEEEDLTVRFRVLPDAKEIDADEVVQLLWQAGIEIDPTLIGKTLKKRSGEWEVVARGTPPIPPVHGRLEYYVDPGALDRTPHVDESGNIDYKDLRLFLNVEEGSELVRKHDPVHGKPGTDVYGKTIPAEEAQTVELPVGEGIKIVEDGYLAIASIGGALAMVEDHLTVMEVFRVNGDVNYKTGNIDFNGNVDISRDILNGFEVKATGDVIVRGVVEAAHVEAKGDIQVFGGFQGDKKGVLEAGGDIRVHYANEGTLEAGGNVIAHAHLLHCRIQAAEAVVVESGNGVLAGGEVRAGERIESRTLGTEAGVRTILQIGMDQELPKKIQAAQEIVVALLKVKRPIENRKQDVEKMREELEGVWNGRVVCGKILYPGVVIRFPGTEFEAKDMMRSKTFTCSNGRIENAPLKK